LFSEYKKKGVTNRLFRKEISVEKRKTCGLQYEKRELYINYQLDALTTIYS